MASAAHITGDRFSRTMMAVGFLVLLSLPLPLIFVAWVSFSDGEFLRIPPPGYSFRWYIEFISSGEWMYALGVSLLLATLVALSTTATAVLGALAVEKSSARQRGAFEFLVLLPLLFPHAAMAIALHSVNQDLKINGTFVGILLAHAILCMPFAYRPIAVNLRSLDPAQREAAMSLGAGPVYTFWRVTLPQLRPGITTSLWFSFIISFDEVNVTMFLVGTQLKTLPVKTYSYLADSADPIVAAISVLLVIFTVSVVLLLKSTVGLNIFLSMEGRAEGPASKVGDKQ